jgi:hypothetical protein
MNQRTIGIPVTNTDRSAFAQRQPDDGKKFAVLMQHVRPNWAYRVFDCTAGAFPGEPRACDGYIVGGSPASVNDADPWI